MGRNGTIQMAFIYRVGSVTSSRDPNPPNLSEIRIMTKRIYKWKIKSKGIIRSQGVDQNNMVSTTWSVWYGLWLRI